ncbi:MAG: nucleotidyltransferase domain-containing protein [Acidobacteria bacterium]|nr:nucleotidyltransferase domain-containing protein [Acidobacteriota bacterium]
MLRIDAALHASLREVASEAGMSLNEYCARKLALPGENVSGPASMVVERAARLAGPALLGVVAFGSWARGDLADSSDVDLLIVLDEEMPIHRRLYREWDSSPMRWGDHLIEPHFVYLPPDDGSLSGVWAEVAVEGIVLFERELIVSRRLVQIRRRIASGAMVRRSVHGQHYWVKVA